MENHHRARRLTTKCFLRENTFSPYGIPGGVIVVKSFPVSRTPDTTSNFAHWFCGKSYIMNGGSFKNIPSDAQWRKNQRSIALNAGISMSPGTRIFPKGARCSGSSRKRIPLILSMRHPGCYASILMKSQRRIMIGLPEVRNPMLRMG